MKIRKRRGFTLLELIIVVIVIGILASIALPRYVRIAEKGRVSEAKAVLGAIRSAQMRYSAQYARYAGALTSLDLNFPPAKYFTFTIPAAASSASLNDGSAVIGVATRTNLDNPMGSQYVVNITMDGTIQADTTGTTVL